jgi:tRNA threonylcarbamoyladenosine biosynthesis protein TsaB
MRSASSLLAIDATTSLCSVAWTDGERMVERVEEAGHRHSELVLGMVSTVLAEAGVPLSAVGEFAFGAGPGSFTGLRIACGVTQGLALAANKRVRPVSSLLALAEATGRDAVLTVIDARMNEVYWAAYRRDGQGAPWRTIRAPEVSSAALVAIPEGPGWLVAGDALAAHPALAARLVPPLAVDAHARITAAAIARLAWRGEAVAVDAADAVPEYVRDKVALTTAERAATA